MLYGMLWTKSDSWVVLGGIFITASSLSPNDESESGAPEIKSGTSPVAEWVTLDLHWAVIFPNFSLLSSAETIPAENTIAAYTISLLSCHCRVQSRSGTLTSMHTHMQSSTHIHTKHCKWVSELASCRELCIANAVLVGLVTRELSWCQMCSCDFPLLLRDIQIIWKLFWFNIPTAEAPWPVHSYFPTANEDNNE